ncbi:MAG TPA: LysR substrate-binding domain-containing protein [Longimicrobium sp.]|nr:LysR substrate-binding domain-containing protein [Longimicrobium sp.]
MDESVDLRHLRYFAAVAEELHFGRAARRLGIAQPPLSQQIQRLEETLGCALFTRRPRVALTPAGEALLGVARRALAQVAQGLDATRRAGRGEAGTLTVGFAASTMLGVLPAVLRAYRERFPAVELRLRELSTSAQTEALRDGTIDVGFLREPGPDEALVCEPVLREPLVAVLPPGHPLGGRRSLPLATLAEEPFVHFPREVAPTLHDQVMALCRAAGFAPRVVQVAQEWLTIVGLVESGLGVSLAPASFRRLRWGGVRYVPLSPPGSRTIVALCRARETISPTVDAFFAVAREAAREFAKEMG